mgnify:FL=1|nr:MAG TPA: hypothetical protein [Caudoviricetes sp.]
MLRINKQKMKYSLQGKRIEVYERDQDGNIKFYESDSGEKIPLIKKEVVGFSEPTIFYANISNKLSEVLAKQFGIDDSTNYAQIITDKGSLPIKAGDLIWKKSDVKYDEDGIVDSKSADYTVMGVADEGLTVDLFLLKRNVIDSEQVS